MQNLLLTLPAAVLPLGLLIGMGIWTLVQTARAQQLLLKQAQGENTV